MSWIWLNVQMHGASFHFDLLLFATVVAISLTALMGSCCNKSFLDTFIVDLLKNEHLLVRKETKN